MLTEKTIQDCVITYFKAENWTTVKEAPFLGHRIDVVAFKEGTREILAVETKLAKWKKALQQALTYRLVANRVYIAMWHEFLHRVNLEILEDFGIGLLRVDGTVNTVLEANQSNLIHESLRRKVESLIDEYRGNHYDK